MVVGVQRRQRGASISCAREERSAMEEMNMTGFVVNHLFAKWNQF